MGSPSQTSPGPAAWPLRLWSCSREPQLRKLGMPVQLVKGQVTLLVDFTVCQEGETLSREQARILKLLGHQQAAFRLNIVSGWNKAEGVEVKPRTAMRTSKKKKMN